jgi:hypothetical protein
MHPSERIDDIVSQETAEALGIHLDIVEAVNRFQWKTANEAHKLYKTIEITDLGVFKTSNSKVSTKRNTLEKKKRKYLDMLGGTSLTDRTMDSTLKKLGAVEDDIEFVKMKE